MILNASLESAGGKAASRRRLDLASKRMDLSVNLVTKHRFNHNPIKNDVET